LRSLERFAQSLKPGGCIIVSTYAPWRRSRAVLRDAKRAFEVVDEAKNTQGLIHGFARSSRRRRKAWLRSSLAWRRMLEIIWHWGFQFRRMDVSKSSRWLPDLNERRPGGKSVAVPQSVPSAARAFTAPQY
jgi:hypothetical protein